MQRGVTLIELIVVIFIIIVITAMIIPNYRAGGRKLALDRSAHKLAQDIRRAQEIAMSPRRDCLLFPSFSGGYGIYLQDDGTGSYHVFADCDNSTDFNLAIDEAPSYEPFDLYFEGDVTINDLSSDPFPFTVVFSPPDPTITLSGGGPSGWIELAISGESRRIYVNTAGLIYVE
jgi:type II secretory pathway pseudopilin PulG